MTTLRYFATSLFTVFILAISLPMHAALQYEQELTITSWVSLEDVQKSVQEFCAATLGEPYIKVIDVKYKTKKKSKKNISYSGIITCHVSEIDADLLRIQGKLLRQKFGVVEEIAQSSP